jgi:hypothetical protein
MKIVNAILLLSTHLPVFPILCSIPISPALPIPNPPSLLTNWYRIRSILEAPASHTYYTRLQRRHGAMDPALKLILDTMNT